MSELRPIDCIEVYPEHVFRNVYNSPFDASPDFTDSWWNEVPYSYRDGGIEFLSFRDAETEVARVQLLLNRLPNPDYGVPRLAAEYVDLAFFEVAASRWRQDVGTRAVKAISARYRDLGLLAYSEDADGFWDEFGWQRFEHPEGTRSFRPLYVRSP